MMRNKYNNTLGLPNIDESVLLVGWISRIRKHGSLTFIDLRDTTGIVQVVLNETLSNTLKLSREDLIQVQGVVSKRLEANPKLKTGEIEVNALAVNLISKSETPPFIIENESDALEETRLEYRYLDIRRPILQETLKLRSRVMQIARKFLVDHDFYEIDTPLLVLSTPEGARDYVVPSRITPGAFYALPQSPQIYKQLLMIGGMERYFQIAHCLRDEDLRADRQPEFMQLDIETSFLNQEELLSLIEKLAKNIFEESIGYTLKTPFRQMPYREAISRFGSDKPDTRYSFEIHDFPFKNETTFNPFLENEFVRYIKLDGHADYFSRKIQDQLNLEAKKFGLGSLAFLKMNNNLLEGSIKKYLTPELEAKMIKELQINDGDTLIFAYGSKYLRVSELLGSLRISLGTILKLKNDEKFDPLWVVDFPLFEWSEAQGRYVSSHHPFTRPNDRDLKYLDTDPSKVYSYAYDLVINGYEVAGGSLRIYDQTIQKKIFDLLGFSEEDIARQFGFFVEAFKYGTPPHAGLAFGMDRLIMLLSGTDNIRDVIAFPKNLRAVDPMSKAPQQISQAQLDELGLVISKKEEN